MSTPITFPTHGSPGGPGGNGQEVLLQRARRAIYRTTTHAKAKTNVLVVFQSYIASVDLCTKKTRAREFLSELDYSPAAST